MTVFAEIIAAVLPRQTAHPHPTGPLPLGAAHRTGPHSEETTPVPTAPNEPRDFVVHGHHNPPGTVVLESADGTVLRPLPHIVHHSPTGLSWGYEGSGPADLARSILIAALGDQARCPDCHGRGRVVYNPDADEIRPFDDVADQGTDPDLVSECGHCGDGYRHLPYQDFKREHVAGWGDEWRISRTDILAWLDRNEVNTHA